MRARLVVALLAMAVLLSGAFYYAAHRLFLWVEEDLRVHLLDRELAQTLDLLRREPDVQVPARDDQRVYVIDDAAALDALPPRLRSLEPGRPREMHLDGHTFQAKRQDLGSRRVIVAMDIQDVESLEAQMVRVALAVIALCLLVALLVALLLARTVLGPVRQLAAAVTALDPARRGQRVEETSGDPEMRRIAVAFDQFLDRLDAYVSRERAFTDQASHELRTPLATIDSAAQLLRRHTPPGDAATAWVARIERSVAQMHSLIEALLFLARADGGLAQDEVMLDTLLLEACEAHQSQLEGRDLQLTCQIEASRSLRAPRGMVLCVINNLLGNAIRHTVRGPIHVRLEAGCIVVQDSGPGVPVEDVPHIFELGYRGKSSRGQGLGLYLVRRVCERLGWRIQYAGDGRGACFRVWLEPRSPQVVT